MSTPALAAVTVAVRAYSFASLFRLRDMATAFGKAEVTIVQDELRASYEDGAVAIAFDFGAVVFFDGTDALRMQVIKELSARCKESQPPRTDDYLVDVDAHARPEVRFDRVVVRELNWAVRHVIALLLAQSAALDYYEADVDQLLTDTDRITRSLAERGRLRGHVRNLTRFIGHCIETKNEVIETLALFDKPDVAWEEEALDRLFTRLREMLEIDDRFRAMEYRLRTLQDTMVLLVDLQRGESTYRLEVLVVLLILMELAVMIWQVASGH